MRNIIVVYSNCNSGSALGDYRFAVWLALALLKVLQEHHDSTRVVLSASGINIEKYRTLYPQEEFPDSIIVQGTRLWVKSLERIDPARHHVVAFVDANRCAYPQARYLQRILAPESKILFVYAPNGDTPGPLPDFMTARALEQRGVYYYYGPQQLLTGVSGIGDGKLGLPDMGVSIPPETLTVRPYGFMYFSCVHEPERVTAMLKEYLALSAQPEYVAVGFIREHIVMMMGQTTLQEAPSLPEFRCHETLPNAVMRRSIAASGCLLIGSTGTFSTLEVMQEGKLPYYEYYRENRPFVESVLNAVRARCHEMGNDTAMVTSVMRLSQLLFARKPLGEPLRAELSELLLNSMATQMLITINKGLIAEANGTLAAPLAAFILSPVTIDRSYQCETARKILQRDTEDRPPKSYDALVRAILQKHMLAFKVLLQALPDEKLHRQGGVMRWNPLHFAAASGNVPAVRLLLQRGLDPRTTDRDGATPKVLAADARYSSQRDRSRMFSALRRATTAAVAHETSHAMSYT